MNLEQFKVSLGLSELSDDELKNRIVKFCNGCKTFKPISEFNSRSDRGSADQHGKVSRCRDCTTAACSAWYAKNTEYAQQTARARGYINRHGSILADGEADKLSKNNQGSCDICGTFGMIHIDHCHRTGSRRGFLCSRCNLAIGQFDDNEALLQRAIMYLALYKEIL